MRKEFKMLRMQNILHAEENFVASACCILAS